jgi:pyrimidine operon attenuation protein/uracil phosphoribosyltransferase
VLDAAAIDRALRRIAHEIIERNPDLASVVLAGIPSRGVEIARRLADTIESLGKVRLFRYRSKTKRSSSSTTFSSPAALPARLWTRSVLSAGRREFNSRR